MSRYKLAQTDIDWLICRIEEFDPLVFEKLRVSWRILIELVDHDMCGCRSIDYRKRKPSNQEREQYEQPQLRTNARLCEILSFQACVHLDAISWYQQNRCGHKPGDKKGTMLHPVGGRLPISHAGLRELRDWI